MEISRRDFVKVTASGLSLLVLNREALAGPHDDDWKTDPNASAKLAGEAFLIGEPAKFDRQGVYADWRSKGVWIVRDGSRLIALSSRCTHLNCPVSVNSKTHDFRCPCHGSRFTTLGVNANDSQKAKRPLERCTIALVESDGKKQLRIDPTRRFKKDSNQDQFNDPAAGYSL